MTTFGWIDFDLCRCSLTRSLTPYQVNERENEKLTDPPMTPVGRVGSPPKPPWVESQMGFQASTGWPLSLGLSSCSSPGAVTIYFSCFLIRFHGLSSEKYAKIRVGKLS